MANFFQKLFSKNKQKNSTSIHNTKLTEPASLQAINTANNSQNNSQDRRILENFSNNKHLLHRVFVPIFNFSTELKIKASIIADITRDAFQSASSHSNLIDFERVITRKINSDKNELWEELENMYDDDKAARIIENISCEKLQHHFLYLGDYPSANLSHFSYTISSLINQNTDTDYYFQCYIRSEIETALLKAFVFEKELSNIHNNEELLKILTNAAYKYQNLDIISERTYELFLDYYALQKQQFSYDSYTELIRVFFATKQSCNEFYKSEELVFEFDIHALSLEEITNQTISDKLYKKYDVEKLLISLAYEKVADFATLLEFVNELKNIAQKCEKVKKAAIKDDLLNGDYTSRKTSIVDVDLMAGVEFEEFLCNYFNTHGYVCNQTKVSGDQGIDLVAKKDDYVLAIQAKRYTGTVGNHAIMEAVAGTKYYNANQTMVITNSTFTKSAVELAAANNVILWDRQVLIEKLANS